MGSAVGILAEGESYDGSVDISKYLDLDSFLKGGSLQKKGKKIGDVGAVYLESLEIFI